MNHLTYQIAPDGLGVDVLIQLDGGAILDLVNQGGQIPAPIRCRGLIDSGTNMTAVSAPVLRQLGIPVKYQTATRSITGTVAADVYEVSLSITDFNQARPPALRPIAVGGHGVAFARGQL